jgi:hypothetical protein
MSIIEPTPSDTALHEITEILRQVREKVIDERKAWVDIACAILLALATMGSAWCAYEATLWGGVQTFRLAATNKAGRESSEAAIAAIQYRSFDAAMFISYIEAKHAGDVQTEQFLYARFRPEMKTAVDEWLKADPFNNPSAPSAPFKLPQYVQPEQEEMKRQEQVAADMYAAAQRANQISDRYVLLTVMFASVLFFGGIDAMVRSPWLRKLLFIIAMTTLVLTMIVLTTMPICWE